MIRYRFLIQCREGMHAIVTLFAWTLWLESPSEELIFLVRFNGCFPSAICE